MLKTKKIFVKILLFLCFSAPAFANTCPQAETLTDPMDGYSIVSVMYTPLAKAERKYFFANVYIYGDSSTFASHKVRHVEDVVCDYLVYDKDGNFHGFKDYTKNISKDVGYSVGNLWHNIIPGSGAYCQSEQYNVSDCPFFE